MRIIKNVNDLEYSVKPKIVFARIKGFDHGYWFLTFLDYSNMPEFEAHPDFESCMKSLGELYKKHVVIHPTIRNLAVLAGHSMKVFIC